MLAKPRAEVRRETGMMRDGILQGGTTAPHQHSWRRQGRGSTRNVTVREILRVDPQNRPVRYASHTSSTGWESQVRLLVQRQDAAANTSMYQGPVFLTRTGRGSRVRLPESKGRWRRPARRRFKRFHVRKRHELGDALSSRKSSSKVNCMHGMLRVRL